MRFASVAEVRNKFSEYLSIAHQAGEPIVVTHHGKPYAFYRGLHS